MPILGVAEAVFQFSRGVVARDHGGATPKPPLFYVNRLHPPEIKKMSLCYKNENHQNSYDKT